MRAALAIYRPERTGRLLNLQDLDDVCLLAGPEIARRRQRLDWSAMSRHAVARRSFGNGGAPGDAQSRFECQRGGGRGGTVTVSSRIEDGGGTLILSVGDTGPGLPETSLHVLTSPDPGPAGRAGRGLGLWMVRQMVEDVRGSVHIRSRVEGRPLIELHLPLGGKGEISDTAWCSADWLA